eukprot:CAMPEP_0114629516 /NCGR_PEP_ID=MMETSP0168-20121206/13401_1 /TAXON_ID=95228 ORGANISM="Vannella sp., Strain DIVA3 517/6/12" /NCGR_SAMPLE_ID=MMETSP0168 /ASSEMBLY_ACC=CAM_ASM_000044 /LENGTH=36 /DNA_ID= /DNA_START= /DNA_END= /DNA_ORIENTATION=
MDEEGAAGGTAAAELPLNTTELAVGTFTCQLRSPVT